MFTPEYLNELVEATSPAAAEFNMYLTNKVIDSIVGLFEYNGKIEIAPSNAQMLRMLVRPARARYLMGGNPIQ